MLHKIVEKAKQMISVIVSLNILVMHITKIFSFFAEQEMLITTIGIITIGAGMLVTIFGKEIVIMIKKNFSFHWKDQE